MKQFLLLGVLGLVLTARWVPVYAQGPPNVLMVIIDDLNTFPTPYGEHPDAITPNLDRVAQRGVRFNRAYANFSLCNPSRISFMSGLLPENYDGLLSSTSIDDFMPDAVTLPQYIEANGYNTFGFGKVFHNFTETNLRYQEALIFLDDLNTTYPSHGYTDVLEASGSVPFEWGPIDDPDDFLGDDANADHVVNLLQTYSDTAPFFITVGFRKPHLPFHAPRRFFDLYDPTQLQLPPGYLVTDLDDVPLQSLGANVPDLHMALTDDLTNTQKWREALQAYLACISFVDYELGRLLDALDASPFADDTIVMVFSDHGYMMGEKLHYKKNNRWEEANRIPWMAYGPGLDVNTAVDTPVSLIDLYPTMVDLLNLPPRTDLDGVSLAGLMQPGGPAEGVSPTPATNMMGWNLGAGAEFRRSLRSATHKYILNPDGTEEFYDAIADPYEWTNLAGNPAHDAARLDHKTQLAQALTRRALCTASIAGDFYGHPISDLSYWLDAGVPDAIVDNTTRPFTWRDRSGRCNNFAQNMPARYPEAGTAPGGQAGVYFDGNDALSMHDLLLEADAFTLFLVLQADTTDAKPFYKINVHNRLFLPPAQLTLSSNQHYALNRVGDVLEVGDRPVPGGVPYILALRKEPGDAPADLSIWRNERLQQVSASLNTALAFENMHVSLGGDHTEGFRGWVFESALVRTALDDAAVTGIVQALRTKWTIPVDVALTLRLFLSGPFDPGASPTGRMKTDLVAQDLLPLAQPYQTAPFDGTVLDYDGSESVALLLNNRVDWVLVDLRTDTNILKARQAGLLAQGGGVYETSGAYGLRFYIDQPGAYHVVLRHGNHLPVMSALPLNLTSTNMGHFSVTDDPGTAFGTNPLQEVEPGIWGLWPGDGNVDGHVTAFDFLNVWLPANGSAGYMLADYNLDGSVSAFDFLQQWLVANGQSSQVPE